MPLSLFSYQSGNNSKAKMPLWFEALEKKISMVGNSLWLHMCPRAPVHPVGDG